MPARPTFRGPSSWGGESEDDFAPEDAPFIVATSTPQLPNSLALGSVILPPDLLANRPLATTVPAGAVFYASDTGQLYRSTGTTWDDYSDVGGSGGDSLVPLLLPAAEVFTVGGQAPLRFPVELGAGAYFEIEDDGILMLV